MSLRLSTASLAPAEGDILALALSDQSYGIAHVQGGLLLDTQSGEVIDFDEVIAWGVVEAFPFGREPIHEGDEVTVEVPGRPPTRRLVFEHGRVLHTHGDRAWVRLVRGGDVVVDLRKVSRVS
jgi:hypothetical protein